MTNISTLIAAATALLAFQADAAVQPSFDTVSAGPAGAYVSSGGASDVAVASSQGMPASGVAIVASSKDDSSGSSTNSAVTTINLDGATSFRFLWSTPDKNSSITIDGTTYTGEQLLNGHADGPVWATFTSTTGMHSVSFADVRGGYQIALASSGDDGTKAPDGAVSIEIPVNAVVNSPTNVVGAVPEPQTYALMLAGLGIGVFVAKRRTAS